MEAAEAEVEDGELGGETEAAAAAQEPPKKKAKLAPGEKRYNGAVNKVATLQAAFTKKEQQIAAAMSKAATKPLPPKEEQALAGWRAKAEKISEELEAAREEVEEAKKTMASLATAAQQKEEEKAQKEEVARALSEPGAIKLVELWCSSKYQERLNNSSDTVQSIFEHIHADFVKAVHKGDLPSSDERGVAALRKKCVPAPQTQLPPPARPPHHVPTRAASGSRAGSTASLASSSFGAASRSEPWRTRACRPTRWWRGWISIGGALAAPL